ncbi:MAG: carboxypeptidase regulatory-like domain-containing protein [Acidobacteria bacterium]|nr:carboxypeptidase regulatory-like domain-containing protein [Acidobacteriota bacterium]
MPLMLVGFALIAALTCDVPKTAGTCGSASQDEVSPVRLSGGVFDEANAPVAGARVLLLPEPRQPMTGPPPQTMTDLDGRFSFARVPPGQYRVDTQKPGFVRMADVVSLPRIDLAAGQAIDGVVLYLRRGGVITGRVLDPGGQPLAEARVMAVRRLTAKGSPDRLVPAGQGGVTNDLGEFRIIGLLPGAYYVSAAPRMPTAFETPGRSATTMIATFFPGTPGASGAQAVTVASAQTVPDIIFRLA